MKNIIRILCLYAKKKKKKKKKYGEYNQNTTGNIARI